MEESQLIRKHDILKVASKQAMIWGGCALGIAGLATVVASKRWRLLRDYPTTTIKASFAPSVGATVYMARYEYVAYRARDHPESYGLKGTLAKGEKPHLSMYKRIANFTYDNPLTTVAVLTTPIAAVVLVQMKRIKEMPVPPQSIMRTRGFAQGGVMCIFLVVIAFGEYMRNHGKFTEEQEEQYVWSNSP